MAVKPLKDPAYEPVPGKLRRYRVRATGEVINRTEYERRTNPAKANKNPAGSTGQPRKNLGRLGPNLEPLPAGSTGSPMVGPVPVVEAPEPPPMVAAAYDVAKEAAAVAHAASTSMDRLATKIGQGIAQSVAYASEAFLPARLSYWALPEDALRQVAEPTARLVARHSKISVDLGPDGDDVGDLFVGVMACITALSVQKIQYEQAKLQSIHDFEVKNGPGSYAAAVAASQRAPAGGTQNAGQTQDVVRSQNGAGNGAAGNSTYSGAAQQGDGRITTITDQLLREHANGHRERRTL